MSKANLIRKGKIAEIKEKLEALEIQIDNNCKSINMSLFKTDGVESIDVPGAQQEMITLVTNFSTFKGLKKILKDLEEN